MSFPRLAKAPINEAVIDISVNPSNSASISNLEALHRQIANDYPTVTKRRHWQGVIQLNEEGAPPTAATDFGVDGLVCTSKDRTRIVQLGLAGFAFSWLKPYDNWDRFRNEARRLWEFYRDGMRPTLATRVAVRYVNIMEFPLPLPSLNEYLAAPPVIPKDLPQQLAGYTTRIVIPFLQAGATAVVTQALQPITKPTVVPVLLDIDAFREASFAASGEEIWGTVEQLRDIKNLVFFKNITKKAEKLFGAEHAKK